MTRPDEEGARPMRGDGLARTKGECASLRAREKASHRVMRQKEGRERKRSRPGPNQNYWPRTSL